LIAQSIHSFKYEEQQMRFLIPLLSVLAIALGASTAVPAAAPADGYVLALDQQPSGTLDVNIDINEGGGDWWANPIWIGIGSVGVLLILVLVVMAARGGGTTVIKG
jgi:hypothetical protein